MKIDKNKMIYYGFAGLVVFGTIVAIFDIFSVKTSCYILVVYWGVINYLAWAVVWEQHKDNEPIGNSVFEAVVASVILLFMIGVIICDLFNIGPFK